MPAEPAPPQMLIALLRSAPSSNVDASSARMAGDNAAPPRPWIARPAINSPGEVANPPASDPIANRPTPSKKSVRDPYRSTNRPPSSRRPPNAIA